MPGRLSRRCLIVSAAVATVNARGWQDSARNAWMLAQQDDLVQQWRITPKIARQAMNNAKETG
jgi:hypothetical protein